MKRTLGILLFVLGGVADAAEDPLAQISALLEAPSSMQGEFVQTTVVQVLNAPLVSRGRFYVDRARGVSWHVEHPLESVTVFSPDGGSSSAGVNWIGGMLHAAFLGDLAALERTFVVSAQVRGPQWSLALTPRSDALSRYLQRIDLRGGTTIEAVEVTDPNGDHIQIEFAGVESLAELPPEIQSEFDLGH